MIGSPIISELGGVYNVQPYWDKETRLVIGCVEFSAVEEQS